MCILLIDARSPISFHRWKTREYKTVKRGYFIAAGLVVAGALALRAPHQAKPSLTVTYASPPVRPAKLPLANLTVYVVGAVGRTGVYHLRGGTRIQDAVEMAGGLTAQADPAGVNLAELLTDGEEISVPSRGETGQAGKRQTPRTSRRHAGHSNNRTANRSPSRHRKTPPGHPVDINSADAGALQELPGVGPALAQRLIDFREVNGPFHAIDDLTDVAGMTDRHIEKVAPYITLRQPR